MRLRHRARINSRRARPGLVGLAAMLALVVGLPASASANGDPPGDVLLQQDVYFPYTPPTSDAVARALLELTRRTRADGWPIKVAIIATLTDLGDLPGLFTKPQQYANFLAKEIHAARVLVVTPVGFGGLKLGAGVDRALSGLDPVQPGDDRLERQALLAVQQLAALDGHRVPAPRVDTSAQGRRPYRQDVTIHRGTPTAPRPVPAAGAGPGKHGGGTSPLVFVAPIALALLLLGGVRLRDRLKRSDAP